MSAVLRPSDMAAVVGVIDPDAYAANSYSTGWIALASFEKLMAVVSAGTLGTNATIDAKFEMAKDSGGTDADDVTGTDATQLTQAGTDESDKQVVINLVAEDIDVNNGFTHARLTVTVGTATSDMGAVVIGFNARYAPGVDSDLASVAQVVN